MYISILNSEVMFLILLLMVTRQCYLQFYNATITAVTDTTCVVHFKDYGNMEEVLKNDCKPVNKRPKSYQHQDQRNQNARFYGGRLISILFLISCFL